MKMHMSSRSRKEEKKRRGKKANVKEQANA
jgi:hypothetical protein